MANIDGKDRPSILDDAKKAVEQRREAYGSPKPNFERIKERWNLHLRQRGLLPASTDPTLAIDETDVAVMMAEVKLARLIETPDHRDSVVDWAGYADCYAEVM